MRPDPLRQTGDSAPPASWSRPVRSGGDPRRKNRVGKRGVALDIMTKAHPTPHRMTVDEALGLDGLPQEWHQALKPWGGLANVMQRDEEGHPLVDRGLVEAA